MARDARGVSPTMLAAIEHARAHGGELVRFPGGFWSHANWKGAHSGEVWFGTSSVNALINRGLVVVVERKQGEAFTFPVRVRALEKP